MPQFTHDSIDFYYHDSGTGDHVFVIQHGLGGNADDLINYVSHPHLRVIGMDARGHGNTIPLGVEAKLNFKTMADDMMALLDVLNIEKAIIGGISMGAGIALNVGLRHPERVHALLLSRPAWLNAPMPTEALYHEIADIIRNYSADEGLIVFKNTSSYRQLKENAPAVADSLCNLFGQERAKETVAKLERIASDQPLDSFAALAQITAPTLVLITQQDPVHPYQYGEFLAEHIPRAELVELTAKSVDAVKHDEEGRQAITNFVDKVLAQL